MEVVMLERYFFRPQTVDRIRANWLGSAIERYVEWLEREGYSARNVYRRVPVLCHFSRFVEERGVPSLEQAAVLVEDFAQHWLNQHGRDDASALARSKVAEEARNPVNQMLKVVLPKHGGGGRHAKRWPNVA
jgi:integrase/recombinase XerD